MKLNKMQIKSLRWQLIPSHLFVAFLALIITTWIALSTVKSFYEQHLEQDLETRIIILISMIDEKTWENPVEADALCKTQGKAIETRFTLVKTDGTVIGDTDENPAEMDNHKNRPEIITALEGNIGNSQRFSNTQQRQMLYITLPYKQNGEIAGVVRASFSLASVQQFMSIIYFRITIGIIIAILLAGLVSWIITIRISRPLEKMRKGAEKFARGDLSSNLDIPRTAELETLANALNHMAEQLNERMEMMDEQRNEQQAILSSMSEGVIAMDNNDRIISINDTAIRMLNIRSDENESQTVQDQVRNSELNQIIQQTRESQKAHEEDITFEEKGKQQILMARSSVLFDSTTNVIGCLIVLNDVSHIRRLESMRKEFVSNVSHELKTPITSIKGFTETLLDGAMENKDELTRFLTIIANQTNRLNAIIQDLLTLSRIEQEQEWNTDDFQFQLAKISEILNTSKDVCVVKSQEKNVAIHLDFDPELTACVNAPLIEQAVINLMDNAIKYSEIDGDIYVKAWQQNDEIFFEIKDQGSGIPDSHFPRLFERFYRVDKARSRKLGGTGLGLAIVKHIALVHGGRTEVQSQVGKGATFRIIIPLREPEEISDEVFGEL